MCDSDWYAIEGWIDVSGGELCYGSHRCDKLWHDTACVSYLNQLGVYGFALR